MMMSDLYREDLFVRGGRPNILPKCLCYPAGSTSRAHLMGCRLYSPTEDPFIRPFWFIHKAASGAWTVCKAAKRQDFHLTAYQGATWEDAVVWLAVEYGRRRKERRALEAIMKEREWKL